MLIYNKGRLPFSRSRALSILFGVVIIVMGLVLHRFGVNTRGHTPVPAAARSDISAKSAGVTCRDQNDDVIITRFRSCSSIVMVTNVGSHDTWSAASGPLDILTGGTS